ncbi:MAG: hypothetical protein K0U37_05780 [Gammaproteobacteria bacterium]|nr:hypothetical protein [Gammaproteobacteria bacterium]
MKPIQDNWRDLDQRIMRLKSKLLLQEHLYSKSSYSDQQNAAREVILEHFDEIFSIKTIGDKFISTHTPPLLLFPLIKLIDGLLTRPELALSTRPAEEIEQLYDFSKSEDPLKKIIFTNILVLYRYPEEQTQQAIDVEKHVLPLLYHRDTLKYQDPIKIALEPLITHFRDMLLTATEKDKAKIISEIEKTDQYLNNKIGLDEYQPGDKRSKSAKTLTKLKQAFNKKTSTPTQILNQLMLELSYALEPLKPDALSDTDTETEMTDAETHSLTSSLDTNEWDGKTSFDIDSEGEEDDDEEEEEKPLTPEALLMQETNTKQVLLKEKVAHLKIMLDKKHAFIKDNATYLPSDHMIQTLKHLSEGNELDLEAILKLNSIAEHLKTFIQNPRHKTWNNMPTKEKEFFLNLEKDETLSAFSSMIHFYKPFTLTDKKYAAYITTLKNIKALSNQEDPELTPILNHLEKILDQFIKDPMQQGVWDWVNKQDQQTILRLFRYPHLAPLGEQIIQIYGLFDSRIEQLKRQPLTEAFLETPIQASAKKNAETEKKLTPLKRYIDETNRNRSIEAKTKPLMAVFSTILASGSEEEQTIVAHAIKQTTALLTGTSIPGQTFDATAEKAKASSSLNIQMMGNLMLELETETLKKTPFQVHIGRVNTLNTQRHLAPLDKYLDKHPELRAQLEPLMSVFSDMLESNTTKDQTEAVQQIKKTTEFLHGRLSVDDYQKIAKKAKGAPSPVWKVMGALMIALSAAALAFGLVTGVVPASIAGGVGLATGFGIFSKAAKRTGVSKGMLDLSEKTEDKSDKKDDPSTTGQLERGT